MNELTQDHQLPTPEMKVISFQGGPGAGKGTHCLEIIRKMKEQGRKTTHVSTGDLLRAERAIRSPIGIAAEEIMTAGGDVPDEMITPLFRDRMRQIKERQDTDVVLLDGYPRAPNQVNFLTEILTELGLQLDAVIDLEVTRDELARRAHKRLTETPAEKRRAEDLPEAHAIRMDVYQAKMEPVKERLRLATNRYETIDANGSLEDTQTLVHQKIKDLLGL